MRIATLFSGIGSPEQGAKRVYDNLDLVFACEWDKYARESFKANYEIEDKHFHIDINDMDGTKYNGKVDILIGGSPCQDFSLAGLRAGVDGQKGILIYQYIRIIKEVQPPIFIYENVKGMLSDKKGKTIKEFVEAFRDLGYFCHYEVLNTKDYRVPQNRERIFLVGFKDKEHYYNFSFAPKIKLEKRLKDILEDNVDEKYYLSNKMIDGFINHKNKHTDNTLKINIVGHSGTGGQRGDVLGIDGISSCLSATDFKQPKQIQEPILQQVGTLDIKGNDSIKRVYSSEGLSPCLTTMGGGNREPKIQENYRIRKLTPRECFRLQDFPEDFKFVVSNSQLYKQAGNSISANIMEMIFEQIEASRYGNTNGGLF